MLPVARVPSGFKQARLSSIAIRAERTARTLIEQIQNELLELDAEAYAGAPVQQSSGNGFSFTRGTSAGRVRQDDALTVLQDLLKLHPLAVAELATDGIPTPSDSQIAARMIAMLEGVNSATTDRSAV